MRSWTVIVVEDTVDHKVLLANIGDDLRCRQMAQWGDSRKSKALGRRVWGNMKGPPLD